MNKYDTAPAVSGWKIIGCLGICTLGITGVSVGIYAATSATSGVRGAVALHNQDNTAENRVAAIDQWNTAYKDVNREVANLALARQTYKLSDPQGMIVTAQAACNNSVGVYDNLQNEALTMNWKPTSLPVVFDPNTTCN